MRESLGIGLREFAREAGVPATTLQGSEEGKPPRRDTAIKYARVLQRHGVDPYQVQELAAALAGVFLVYVPPEVVMQQKTKQAWRELTESLERIGQGEWVREELARIEEQHGEEGRQHKEQREQDHREFVAEEMASEDEETEE